MNSTVFVLHLNILALRLWTEKSSYSQLPGSASPDFKYLHARQIAHQLSFHSLTIPDCIRYIIRVFCYNFKSQTKILCFILTHWLLSKLRFSPCSGIYTSHFIYYNVFKFHVPRSISF